MTTHDLFQNDDDIIRMAETILKARMERVGHIREPKSAMAYIKTHLGSRPHEVFAVMFLDTRHNIIAVEDLFFGTIDGAEVHPRVVAKRALELNAAAIICFHNHPSGNPDPSAADRAVTVRLKQALALLDIRMVDHFVVAVGHEPVSMAERGWV